MNFSRSDTYINVYLPREDGGDPRKLVPLNSPMFDKEKIYKFSEQVVKDRKLFLGKKQVSLYELYYKDKKVPSTDEVKASASEEEKIVTSEDEEEIDHGDNSENKEITDTKAPVKRVSLSLDSKVRKLRQLKRFNEPLNPYVTNKKKAMLIKKLDSEESETTDVTRLDRFKGEPQPIFHDSRERQRTFYFNSRERQRTFLDNQERQQTIHYYRGREETFYNTRQKPFLDNTFKLQAFPKPKKSMSAIETRTFRSLGLPPINRTQSAAFNSNKQLTAVSKPMPLRPSSKPQKIWRQSTEALLDRRTPKLSNASRRFLAIQPAYASTSAVM